MFSLVLVFQSKAASHFLGGRDLEAYAIKCFTCNDVREFLDLSRAMTFDMVIIDSDSVTDIKSAIGLTAEKAIPSVVMTSAPSDALEMGSLLFGAVSVFNWNVDRRLLSLKLRRLIGLHGTKLTAGLNEIATERLLIDSKNGRALVDGNPFPLTAQEFQFLLLLASNYEHFVHTDVIRDSLGQSEGRAINMTVHRVRVKLRSVNSGVQIELQYGLGYRLCKEKSEVLQGEASR